VLNQVERPMEGMPSVTCLYHRLRVPKTYGTSVLSIDGLAISKLGF
jgi:hypothetical protein